MRHVFTVGLAGLLAVCLSATAYGQGGKKFGGKKFGGKKGNFLERLKGMDRNKDGKITKDEARGPLRILSLVTNS